MLIENMENKVKEAMARMLAKWLFKDFGLLIEAPEEDDMRILLSGYTRRLERFRAAPESAAKPRAS